MAHLSQATAKLTQLHVLPWKTDHPKMSLATLEHPESLKVAHLRVVECLIWSGGCRLNLRLQCMYSTNIVLAASFMALR